ncbi:fluoride efflux transporter CrcB, partial [Listeria ivanovii]
LAFVMTFLAEKSRLSLVVLNGIGTGFIGAFTTFSAFSVDSIQLLQNREIVWAITYIAVSLMGGLFMVKMGSMLSARLLKRGTHDVS